MAKQDLTVKRIEAIIGWALVTRAVLLLFS